MIEIIKEYKNEVVTVSLFIIVWFKDKIKHTLKNTKKEAKEQADMNNSFKNLKKELEVEKGSNGKRDDKIEEIEKSIHTLEDKHNRRLEFLESRETENKILRNFCEEGIKSIHNLEQGLSTLTETVKGIKVGMVREKELTDMKIKLAKYENK